MKAKRHRTLVALLLLALGAPAHADDTKPNALKRADEYYFSLFSDGTIIPDEKHNPELERSYAIDARFGYKAEHHWGYEVRVFYGKLNTKSVVAPTDEAPPPLTDPTGMFSTPGSVTYATGNRSGIGGDAIYRFGSLLGVRPYVLVGIGMAYSDALPGADWVAPYVNAGVGLSTGSLIELWERPLRVRAEVRYAYEDYRDHYTDNTIYDSSNYLDLHTFVGLEFALTRRVPDAPPPPPQVVPVEDIDADGVADTLDQCPGTGAVTVVDEQGCPK
jgi:hypothetical protein